MAELKTKKTTASVADFLSAIADRSKRADAQAVCALMEEVTGEKPALWGTSIVGFGTYHYRYASGRHGNWFVVGFSPRKANLTLYILPCANQFADQLQQLGKVKTGVSCVYVKKLSDIDLNILRAMITTAMQHAAKTAAEPTAQT